MSEQEKGMVEEENTMAEEKKAMAEEENTMAEEEKPMAEEENTTAEEKKAMAEEENTMAEEKKAMADEENTMAEEEKPMAEEENTMAEEKKAMAEEEKTMAEEEKGVATVLWPFNDGVEFFSEAERVDVGYETRFRYDLRAKRIGYGQIDQSFFHREQLEDGYHYFTCKWMGLKETGTLHKAKVMNFQFSKEMEPSECYICAREMEIGKDVSSLLNVETGMLVCKRGAFHLFHTSCLIKWVLFVEYAIFAKMEKTESKVLCPVCNRAEVEETLGEEKDFKNKIREAFEVFLKRPPPYRPRSTSIGLGFYIEDPSLILDAKVKKLKKKFETKSLEFYGGVSNY